MTNVPPDVELTGLTPCPECKCETLVLISCHLCEKEMCERCLVTHAARHALENTENPIPAGYLVPSPPWADLVRLVKPEAVVCSSRFASAFSPLRVLDEGAIIAEVFSGASKLYGKIVLVAPDINRSLEALGACEVMAHDVFAVTHTPEELVEGYTKQEQEKNGWYLLKRELGDSL